jgi:hypothetical protein
MTASPPLAVADLPGFVPVEWREHRYVEIAPEVGTGRGWLARFLEIDAPLPSGGGCVEEGILLRTPEGAAYLGLSYRGDIPGWRRYVEEAARERGVRVARIDEAHLVDDDGHRVALDVCARERT